jgi:putative ABC transport system permease protein
MFRLTIKHLAANKVRFALTALGVTLAVSFVVSAFILGDGLRSTFTQVSEEVTAGVDLEVRNTADFGEPPPLPPDTVDAVSGIEGVADAVASIESGDNAVRPIRPNGEAIPTNGPPQLAFNWIDNPQLSPFTLVAGHAPQVGEFTMDLDAASEYGFVIGDTYELMTPGGRAHLRLAGTTSFGGDNSTLGATLMQMNTAQAIDLFGDGGIDSVAVELTDDADVTAVQHTIATAIAGRVPTAEVVDHATVLSETTNGFTQEIDVVGNILLGFGFVALFVSIFIIHNTFSIVLGQRTRELALLRTIGAGPAQIRRSVVGEAFVMGVLASAAGIGGGIGIAKGIDALFGLMGVDLSEWPLIIAPRTWVAAALTGIGVTLVAALAPARRAATVPPIAALSGRTESGMAPSRRRVVTGCTLVAGGLVAAVAGLASPASAGAGIAIGAMALFVGVAMLSPLAVGVVTRAFGWPMQVTGGVAGRLAQRNATRNARRTASTAAALMIGLTLVTTALVVGDSLKASMSSTFDRSAKADYYVTDELDDVRFPASLAERIDQSAEIAAVTGFAPVDARIDGTVASVVGVDFDQIGELVDLGVTQGGIVSGVPDPAVISADEAAAIGAELGDRLTVESPGGGRVDATIVGMFDDQAILSEDYLLDTGVLEAVGIVPDAEWVAFSFADDASQASRDAFVAGLADEYPYASVETGDQFRDRMAGTIDVILAMVNAMVALAIVIALIGIGNTLALSVFERTHELGLVRAVGMTRRQVRRMVRFEAALVALFGATLGVGLGLLFGYGVVGALPATFASNFSVPVPAILAVVLVAAGAGVVSALLPARRAGGLDVLDAISH